jgi:hypothetical protein
VVLWVDGPRDGLDTAIRSASFLPPTLGATRSRSNGGHRLPATAPDRRTTWDDGDRPAGGPAAATSPGRGTEPLAPLPAVAVPLLLLLCRRDE